MAVLAEQRALHAVTTKREQARKLLSAWEAERRERRRSAKIEATEDEEGEGGCDDGFAYAEFPSSSQPAQQPHEERVYAIDGAFSHAECDAVLSAVHSAAARCVPSNLLPLHLFLFLFPFRSYPVMTWQARRLGPRSPRPLPHH